MAATAADVISQFKQVDTKSIALQNKINTTLNEAWIIPPYITQKIEDLWNKFLDALKRFWENVKEVFTHLGDPLELWQTAGEWSQKVGSPVSAKVMFADLGALKIDDIDATGKANWSGAAAEKYKSNLLAQRNALKGIKDTFSNGVQDPLKWMAGAITGFWIAMIAAVVAFVYAMYGAFTATGTIVLIPAGIVIAIGAIAGLAGAVAIAIITLRGFASDAKTNLRSALDFSSYLDKKWPQATTN
jgi:hypothetical protein